MTSAPGTYIKNPTSCQCQSTLLKRRHLVYGAEQLFDRNFIFIKLRREHAQGACTACTMILGYGCTHRVFVRSNERHSMDI